MPTTARCARRFDNPGKLGAFEFSPDGNTVAMISAADPNDPSQGRLMVAPAAGGSLRDVLPDLEGHMTAFVWQDAATLMFISDEREETRFGEVDIFELRAEDPRNVRHDRGWRPNSDHDQDEPLGRR